MKKFNVKGFTLIELLAVITIMGILMLVAIPAISRTIENTRRDIFLDTAKQYVNAVKNMWLSDSLTCKNINLDNTTKCTGGYTLASAVEPGNYFVKINSGAGRMGLGANYPIILESGGKSSWGNKEVHGFVRINVSDTGAVTYYIQLTDGVHGIGSKSSNKEYLSLRREDVSTSGITYKATKQINATTNEEQTMEEYEFGKLREKSLLYIVNYNPSDGESDYTGCICREV